MTQTDYLAGAPMTIRNKREIFRAHGMETDAVPGDASLSVLDQWLDTRTGRWHQQWVNVTHWSKSRILAFLGY